MNKVVTFKTGEHCELIHDALMSFFQGGLNKEMTSEELVLEFLEWMDSRHLTLAGKKVIIELGEGNTITEQEVNNFHNTFEKDPLSLLTIVLPPTMNVRFEPACEHLKRYTQNE